MPVVETATQATRSRPIGLYIHIPFCRTLCSYCDFVRNQVTTDIPESFFEAISEEISACEYPAEVRSIYVGGGTPSLVSIEGLGRILDAVRRRFPVRLRVAGFYTGRDDAGVEITIEANPDDVTPDLARAWRSLGINRVSLGVQSFADPVLRYLGRRHDARRARRACEIIGAEFQNWNMDLIYGAHPVSEWAATLRTCAALCPPHVSVYSLTFEKGTPFETRAHEAVDEDVSLGLYRRACEVLGEYDHYEISNFARSGFQCRHNLIYWRNEEYLGFGPGAYSFVDGVRSRHVESLEAYVARPHAKAETLRLTEREIRIETLIQCFRLAEGLSKAYYQYRFGRSVRDDFGACLDGLLERGLLVEDENAIRPTTRGFELNNEIGLALVD